MPRQFAMSLSLALSLLALTACTTPQTAPQAGGASTAPQQSSGSTAPTGTSGTGSNAFTADFSTMSAFSKDWTITDTAASPSDGPSAWTINTPGTLSQTSNIFRSDNEYDNFEGSDAVINGGKDWKNYAFKVTINPTDDDGVGVLFRYQDENNYYRLLNVQDSGNQGPFTRLQVKQNGTYKTLGDNAQALIPSGQATAVEVDANGAHLMVKIGGTTAFDVQDTTFASGTCGLSVYAESGVDFTNLSVNPL
ncbi:MAG TPA: family 16 glycoside hydrolase [Oscillatoriaceae cyanobacterium]